MGLKTNSNGANTYIRFKDGKFFRSNDKETLFSEIEGEIIGLSMADDEFEGRNIRKFIIKMTDGTENYILSLSFDSSYCSDLVAFLKNADLSKTISLVGVFKEDKEGKTKPGILVKQDDVFMKKFYTKDNPNGLPKMKEIMVNKKKVWDKTEFQEFLEDVILNDLAKKVSKTKTASVAALTSAPTVGSKKPSEPLDIPDEQEDEDEDLPF